MGIKDGRPPGGRAHLPASSHRSLILVLRCVLMPSAFLLGVTLFFCFGNRIAAWPPPPIQPSTTTQRPHRRRDVRHTARQKGLQATLLYGLWPCLAAVRSAIVAPNLHWGAAWGAGRDVAPHHNRRRLARVPRHGADAHRPLDGMSHGHPPRGSNSAAACTLTCRHRHCRAAIGQFRLIVALGCIAVTAVYWAGIALAGSADAFVTSQLAPYAFATSLFDLWVREIARRKAQIAQTLTRTDVFALCAAALPPALVGLFAGAGALGWRGRAACTVCSRCGTLLPHSSIVCSAATIQFLRRSRCSTTRGPRGGG